MCVGNFSFAQETAVADYSYCETSRVCGSAPEEMGLLLDFVSDMLGSIKTIGTEWSYLWQYVNPNRFKGEVFDPPTQNIVDKVSRNIAQKLTFSAATLAVLTNPINFFGTKDIAWWTALLGKNKVFLRDVKLIEDLEATLTTKKYELWAWWGLNDQIIDENLVRMQDIFAEYTEAWLFEGSISHGVRYTNITSMMTLILSAAKELLYFDSTALLDSISRADDTLVDIHNIRIVFKQEALKNIIDQYACAKWPTNKCSKEHASLKEIFSSSLSSLTGGWASAQDIFNEALDKRDQTFSKDDQDEQFQAREADLIRSMYGTQTYTKGKRLNTDINGFKELADNSKRIWTWALDGIQDTGKAIGRTWNFFTKKLPDIIEAKKQAKADAAAQANISSDADSNGLSSTTNVSFDEYLQTYVSDVFINQEIDTYLVSLSEIKDVTPKFAQLWEQLYAIKTYIVDGTLLENLSTAAKLQCNK